MKTVAWIRAKNEASIIGETVRHLLDLEAAAVCVLDTGSDDGTPELARAAGAQVVCVELPFYHEALERMMALTLARGHAPDLIIQLDADEFIEGEEPLPKALRRECKRARTLGWTLRLLDLRFCAEHPEEAEVVSDLRAHRQWVEPFYRRLLRVYRDWPGLCFLPFQEHHTALVNLPGHTVRPLEGVWLRHYGLCRSVADFEGKRQRYTTQHQGRAYDQEWQQARCFIPERHLRSWPAGQAPPGEAVEVHLSSNVAKRALSDRQRIVSEVW